MRYVYRIETLSTRCEVGYLYVSFDVSTLIDVFTPKLLRGGRGGGTHLRVYVHIIQPLTYLAQRKLVDQHDP